MLLGLFAPFRAGLRVAFADFFLAFSEPFGEARSSRNSLFQEFDQLQRGCDWICRHALLRVEWPRIVHRPFAYFDVGKTDIDPSGVRRNFADDGACGNIPHVSRLFEVGDIER
jgi:hypothetical protein